MVIINCKVGWKEVVVHVQSLPFYTLSGASNGKVENRWSDILRRPINEFLSSFWVIHGYKMTEY